MGMGCGGNATQRMEGGTSAEKFGVLGLGRGKIPCRPHATSPVKPSLTLSPPVIPYHIKA